jgi:membrane dipeptidase
VIQIPFGSGFVDEECNRAQATSWKEIGAYLDEHDIPRDSEEARNYHREYFARHPQPLADVPAVADHIDHVVQLVGIDHVGLGSDFDGLGNSAVRGLSSVADYPNLVRELLIRGYTEPDLQKICGGNLLRVWSEVERVAGELRAQPE